MSKSFNFVGILSTDEKSQIIEFLENGVPANEKVKIPDYLSDIEREIAVAVSILKNTSDKTQPYEAKDSYKGFCNAFKRAQKYWKYSGQGARTAVGLALSEAAGAHFYKRDMELKLRLDDASYEPKQYEWSRADEILSIFNTTDSIAGEAVTELLDLIIGIIDNPQTEGTVSKLRRRASVISEVKVELICALAEYLRNCFTIQATTYDEGVFGRIAYVAIESFQRHLGIDDDPQNFPNDLKAAIKRSRT